MKLRKRKLYNLSAAVIGSSGNFGKEIVKCLLESTSWSSIVLINRRKLNDVTILNLSYYKDKVKEYIVETNDIERFENSCMGILSMEQCHCLFIAMGIGAEQHLDKGMILRRYVDIPIAFARGAKQGTPTIKHVSILTGIGLEKGSIPYTHDQFGLVPSLISKYDLQEGVRTQTVKKLIGLRFPSLSIFRTTTLIGKQILPNIIGESMVLDAYNMLLDDKDKVIKEKTSGSAHWDGTVLRTEKSEMKSYYNNISSPLLKTLNSYL